MARFLTYDMLRAVLLGGAAHERATLDAAVARLTSVTWDEAEAPSGWWVMGMHVSSVAPALAAVLLGDVESEDGAQGGVALPPSAVGALVLGMTTALARPSSSGSFLWPVSRALCPQQGMRACVSGSRIMPAQCSVQVEWLFVTLIPRW